MKGLVAAFALTCLLVAVPAEAVVPPKNCGNVEVRGKKYNVKADQMKCATAKKYSRNYLISKKRKPSGWSCDRYGKETKLVFRCVKRRANFFAIRR